MNVDDASDANAIQFVFFLDHANLTQHALFPTHRSSLARDLVITSANSSLSQTVISLHISLTDHFPIACPLKIADSPTVHITTMSFVLHVLSTLLTSV